MSGTLTPEWLVNDDKQEGCWICMAVWFVLLALAGAAMAHSGTLKAIIMNAAMRNAESRDCLPDVKDATILARHWGPSHYVVITESTLAICPAQGCDLPPYCSLQHFGTCWYAVCTSKLPIVLNFVGLIVCLTSCCSMLHVPTCMLRCKRAIVPQVAVSRRPLRYMETVLRVPGTKHRKNPA